MRTLAILFVLLGTLACAPYVAAEDAAPALSVEKLADGLWMISGPGGNVGLYAGEGRALLVDAGIAPAAARLLAVADSLLGARPGSPVEFVLNTHYHFDHVGGDSVMAEAGAAIVSHENVRRRMSVEAVNTTFGMTIHAAPARALPVLTFGDSLTFHLGGREVRVFHVPPAHTDGDAVVWLPGEDVLQTGDVFFNGAYPVIDVFAGGSLGGMIRAADRLLAITGPRTRIIPGHGPLADREALLRYRSMLVSVRDRVTKLVRAGRTLAQVQAAKPLADLDDAWGRGFMKPDFFLQVVYEDLAGAPRGDAGRR
jgi:glyoxylase-like metal-dependent hydrolase (beta-lactamase superfamily II)